LPILTIGIAGAFGVGKIFESSELLVQTTGRDPIIIASIAAILAVVALAAGGWPARAARPPRSAAGASTRTVGGGPGPMGSGFQVPVPGSRWALDSVRHPLLRSRTSIHAPPRTRNVEQEPRTLDHDLGQKASVVVTRHRTRIGRVA